jgi:DNA polymerase III alpha subunit
MEKLSKEKQVLGVYVSGHPFEKYVHAFPDCNFDCSFFDDYVEDEDGNRTYNRITDGMRVTMAGIISAFRRTVTKRTGTSMAFITLEDVYGSVDCVCFPTAFEKFRSIIQNDKIVKIKGKLDVDAEKGNSLIVDEIIALDEEEKDTSTQVAEDRPVKKQPVLWLNAGNLSDDDFDEFVNMLSNYDGTTDCRIVRGSKRYKLPTGINYCKGLIAELRAFIGNDDIKYID